jgi:hypothetical protein
MKAVSFDKTDEAKPSVSDYMTEPSGFHKYYSQVRETQSHTPALREAEQVLRLQESKSIANANDASGLPKLEIHFDDTLNYFAEHSLVIDKARRIGYDFEHNPSIAKAVWGGGVVTMAAAAIGIGILKNPAAAAYLAGTGSEALGFGAIGGMAGGSAMQWWYTSAQLKDQLPSSRLPQFKAIRMHE